MAVSLAQAATVEVMPMVGFQFNGSEDLAGPRNNRLDFKSVPLRGLSIGYLNDENGELELSWTRAFSAAQVQLAGGLPPDQFDVRIDRIHLNGLYMLNDGPLQPFGLIGAPARRTTRPSTNLESTTKFSFALGGGLKWLWTDNIGLRFDAQGGHPRWRFIAVISFVTKTAEAVTVPKPITT